MRSHFKTDLNTRAVKKGWVLLEPFIYFSERLSTKIVIPRSFFTDLASVPRWLRWLVNVANGPTRKPAVTHDALCHEEFKRRYVISQADSDLVFLEAMIANGIAPWKARSIYTAVAAFQLAKHRTNYWKKIT